VQDDAPGVFANEPGEHAVGAVAPSEHAEPAGHATQDDCPACDWYLPASQREHVPCPAAAQLPAPHSTGIAAPVAQADPAGHDTQSPAAVSAVPLP